MGATSGIRKEMLAISRMLHKPIPLMASCENFDFVGSFQDAPVVGLN